MKRDGTFDYNFTPLIGKITGFKVTITAKEFAPITKWPIDNLYLYQSESMIKDFDLNKIYQEIYLN